MAGHSKWANIKHRKGAQDKKKAKIFTRIIKEITIASREGGPDPDTNPALRLAVQNGKGANMPKDTIERAIKKGSGADGAKMEEHTFEGYGPGGIAIFVECLSDNTNRTVANVRAVFNKNNGEMGTNGSLSFLFDRKGVFTIDAEQLANHDLDELEMELIEAGLDEMERMDDGSVMIYVSFDNFGSMNKALEEKGIEVKSADLQRIPKTTTPLPLDQALKVMSLIEKMEDDEDVDTVYHNLEMTDELAEALAEE